MTGRVAATRPACRVAAICKPFDLLTLQEELFDVSGRVRCDIRSLQHGAEQREEALWLEPVLGSKGNQ